LRTMTPPPTWYTTIEHTARAVAETMYNQDMIVDYRVKEQTTDGETAFLHRYDGAILEVSVYNPHRDGDCEVCWVVYPDAEAEACSNYTVDHAGDWAESMQTLNTWASGLSDGWLHSN